MVGLVTRDRAVVVASLALVPALVLVRALGSLQTQMTVAGVLAAVVAAWVTLCHPRVTLGTFALVLALVPYAKVPGTSLPLLLVLAVGCWVAAAALPGIRWRVGLPEAGLAVLVAAAGLSVCVTDRSPGALVEYAAWVAATSVVIPVRHLTPPARRAVVASFVWGAGIAAFIGLALMVFDPLGLSLRELTFLGYNPVGGNAQFVHGVESEALRLTGTYVESNIAGLVLATAVLLVLATTRGTARVVLLVLVSGAMALTLSRSALGTVVVAGTLLALLSVGRQRRFVLAGGAVGAMAVLAVPVLRARLLNSFGPSDTGSVARGQALEQFERAMAGHWWWGLGWEREEFRDTVVAWKVNVVANTPLLTLYRGGAIVAVIAVVLLVALVVRTFVVPRAQFEELALACGVAAFCLVALQLDYPVVTQAPATAVFSLLVGLSLGRSGARDE